jgi:predicted alpha/beta-fold hydrolase
LVSLVSPKHGGHCGFSSIGRGRMYWSEQVTVDLLSDFR